MSDYINAEVPFETVGNVQVLSDVKIAQQPWLKEFIAAFPSCFEYSLNDSWFRYYPAGDA